MSVPMKVTTAQGSQIPAQRVSREVVRSTFGHFEHPLNRPLLAGTSTTEYGVRDTLFVGLLRRCVLPDQLSGEQGHPRIRKAKVHTVILGSRGSPEVETEFKKE
jgi:hypothetical protein